MTGLSETEILWELPLCRGMAYMHASLCMDGVDMQFSGASEEDDTMEKVRALIRRRQPLTPR